MMLVVKRTCSQPQSELCTAGLDLAWDSTAHCTSPAGALTHPAAQLVKMKMFSYGRVRRSFTLSSESKDLKERFGALFNTTVLHPSTYDGCFKGKVSL